MKDLPAVSVSGDVYERFEGSLPFNRTLASVMFAKITEATAACGDSGFVTLKALRKILNSEAWAPLADPQSTLSKVLLSEHFKNESKGQAPDQIDSDYLRMFALLHCAGKPEEKARVFFCILQDGGFEKHDSISASDKDLIPVMNKMFHFVTSDIFTLAHVTGAVPEIYTQAETNSLTKDSNIEIIREDIWLEEIYGANSSLTSEAWVNKVKSKASKWIFNPKEIRNKLFAQAKISPRH